MLPRKSQEKELVTINKLGTKWSYKSFARNKIREDKDKPQGR